MNARKFLPTPSELRNLYVKDYLTYRLRFQAAPAVYKLAIIKEKGKHTVYTEKYQTSVFNKSLMIVGNFHAIRWKSLYFRL